MAVSKRTRYEVLKRDNHTCRYCHATDSPLTVDHVTPTALGGTDDPSNLVAACRDCNAGKSSTSPDAALVQQVGEDDIRWAKAVQRAAAALVEAEAHNKARHEWFLDDWKSWDKECLWLPDGWAKSLDHWLGAGLPVESMKDCLDIALTNRSVQHSGVFAYMGGIARKKIEGLHEAARALLDEDDA